jgi:FKBP-type peptidyl-prolyl cis-trans isomerase
MRQDVARSAAPAARTARRGLAVAAVLAAAGCRAAPRQETRPPAEPRPAEVASGKRKVYLTAGHGEFSDPASQPTAIERRSTELRRVLGGLVDEVAELSPRELAAGVPGDAAIVMVLGPSTPLPPPEWAALERYLDRGGRLVIALDPAGATSMGPLEGRLGLRMRPGHLVDDQMFLPQRGTPSDRRFVITTQVSEHPSTSGIVRSSSRGLVVIDAGALEEIPISSKRPAPERTITIRSMESAWLDLDQPQNFEFDAATEQRRQWHLGAAVEGPKLAGKDGFRALVYSDAELFVDIPVMGPSGKAQTIIVSGPLLADSIRWLVGAPELGLAPPSTTAPRADAPDEGAPPATATEQMKPPPDLNAPPADAKTLKSGARYVVLRPGTGKDKARSFDTVTYHVTSWDSEGRQLESTEPRKQPKTLQPYRHPAAIEEVLTSLTVGQRVRLWIDPAKVLPIKDPTATTTGALTFEIELLQIDKAAAAPPPAPPDVARPPAGAKQTERGTFYRVLKAGKGGPKPGPTDTVVVHYTGWTTDGRMFDSSIVRGEPAELPLDAVIAGWTDGLQRVSAGDRVRLWIPEALAYRARPEGRRACSCSTSSCSRSSRSSDGFAGGACSRSARGSPSRIRPLAPGSEECLTRRVGRLHPHGW